MNNTLPEGFVLKGSKPYTIVKPLHNGGFGITYLVKAEVMDGNIPLQAFYTIKEFFLNKSCIRDANQNVVASTPSAQQLFANAKSNFLDEANILHSLQHRNIVPVNEVFQQNNTVYYVMKYLGETTLEQYVNDHGGTLAESDAIDIITPIAYAVEYLHDRKILHLDIKPNNVMMCRENGEIFPVLIDFGQACFPKSKNKVRGYSAGYSASELKNISINPDKTADIYSLAATLLFLITGKTPDDATQLSKRRIYQTLPENVSDRTVDVILRSLQAAPVERYQSVSLFLAELLDNGGSYTDPIDGKKPFPIKTVSAVIGGVLLVALCIFGISHFDFTKQAQEPDSTQETSTTIDGGKDNTTNDTVTPSGSISPNVDSESLSSNKPSVNTPEKKDNSHTDNPSNNIKPENPVKGTVNLGYAVWTGDVLHGKPHGQGTMRFTESHAIDGCSAEAHSGYYIKGHCENGVLTDGWLYDETGQKIEYFVR